MESSVKPTELNLQGVFQLKPVNTHVFSPFLIARLIEHPEMKENALNYHVTLQDVNDTGIASSSIQLTWDNNMIPSVPLAAHQD